MWVWKSGFIGVFVSFMMSASMAAGAAAAEQNPFEGWLFFDVEATVGGQALRVPEVTIGKATIDRLRSLGPEIMLIAPATNQAILLHGFKDFQERDVARGLIQELRSYNTVRMSFRASADPLARDLPARVEGVQIQLVVQAPGAPAQTQSISLTDLLKQHARLDKVPEHRRIAETVSAVFGKLLERKTYEQYMREALRLIEVEAGELKVAPGRDGKPRAPVARLDGAYHPLEGRLSDDRDDSIRHRMYRLQSHVRSFKTELAQAIIADRYMYPRPSLDAAQAQPLIDRLNQLFADREQFQVQLVAQDKQTRRWYPLGGPIAIFEEERALTADEKRDEDNQLPVERIATFRWEEERDLNANDLRLLRKRAGCPALFKLQPGPLVPADPTGGG